VIGFLVFFAYYGIRQATTASATPTAVASQATAESAAPTATVSQATAAATAAATATADAAAVSPTVAQTQVQPGPTAGPDATAGTGGPQAKMPIGVWRPISDLPQQVLSMAVDPARPQVVYAGAVGAVYRSADAGATWLPVSGGLPNEEVVALAVAPGQPGTLYAVVGYDRQLFGSDDDGASWREIGTVGVPPGGYSWQELTVAPSDAKLLYFVAGAQSVAYSPNGGQTWLSIGDGLPGYAQGRLDLLTLAIDPKDAAVVYAGTGGFVGQGHGVFKSTDGGQSWAAANRGMLDRRITALAVDPTDPQVVYAGGDSGELFRSADGGATWTDLSEGLKVQRLSEPRQIRAVVVDPADPNRVFLLGDNSALMFSGDGGQKWQLLGKPGDDTQPYFSVVKVFLTPQLVVVADRENKSPWRYAEGE